MFCGTRRRLRDSLEHSKAVAFFECAFEMALQCLYYRKLHSAVGLALSLRIPKVVEVPHSLSVKWSLKFKLCIAPRAARRVPESFSFPVQIYRSDRVMYFIVYFDGTKFHFKTQFADNRRVSLSSVMDVDVLLVPRVIALLGRSDILKYVNLYFLIIRCMKLYFDVHLWAT